LTERIIVLLGLGQVLRGESLQENVNLVGKEDRDHSRDIVLESLPIDTVSTVNQLLHVIEH